MPPSRAIYPQRAEQQRSCVDADVELARKRRVEQEERKLQRILDLQTKSQEELRSLKSDVAEHQRKLESLQSAISSADAERLRGLEEVHDQHILLSKLKIEQEEHTLRLKRNEEQLKVRENAFAEKAEQAQRDLQEKKNRVDLLEEALTIKNVRTFRQTQWYSSKTSIH